MDCCPLSSSCGLQIDSQTPGLLLRLQVATVSSSLIPPRLSTGCRDLPCAPDLLGGSCFISVSLCPLQGGVKVLITGPWQEASNNYSCLFDQISVPASLIQPGVLRCYCPGEKSPFPWQCMWVPRSIRPGVSLGVTLVRQEHQGCPAEILEKAQADDSENHRSRPAPWRRLLWGCSWSWRPPLQQGEHFSHCPGCPSQWQSIQPSWASSRSQKACRDLAPGRNCGSWKCQTKNNACTLL